MMENQARALSRNVSMSPRKVRLVTDQIRGKSVNDAYAILGLSKKAAAEPVGKALRSAVANAQSKAQDQGDFLDVDELKITTVYVNGGPILKRWRARAMGRASRINKRTSHITVIVDTKE